MEYLILIVAVSTICWGFSTLILAATQHHREVEALKRGSKHPDRLNG